jgi:hypothetical protein
MQIISSQHNKNPYYFVSKKEDDDSGEAEKQDGKAGKLPSAEAIQPGTASDNNLAAYQFTESVTTKKKNYSYASLNEMASPQVMLS